MVLRASKLNQWATTLGYLIIFATVSGTYGCNSYQPPQVLLGSQGVRASSSQVVKEGPHPSTEKTKNTNEAFRAKVKSLAQAANPLEESARELYAAGNFTGALAKIDEARAIWKQIGLNSPPDCDLALECLYKLQKYSTLISDYKKFGVYNDATRVAVGIAFLKTGDLGNAAAFYNHDRLVSFFGPSNVSQTKVPSGKHQLEAALRLARGSELFFTSRTKEAHLEVTQLLSLEPTNPTGLSIAFQTSARLGLTGEANSYAIRSEKIGGAFGKLAGQYLSASRGRVRLR